MIIIIIVILAAALLLAGFFFVRITLTPRTSGYEQNYAVELEKGLIDDDFFRALDKQEFYTPSGFGYQLHGMWFPGRDSARTVIIVHGYTVNLFTSLRYLRLFHDRGFNVLIYDHRFHGKSGGKSCTMGFYEKFDLKTMVDWVIKKTGEGAYIGIHGESMGAATALLHAAIDDRIAFTIADCAYKDLYTQFVYRLKVEYGLPPFPLIQTANLFTRLTNGFFYREVSPIAGIPDIKTPVLFIHGNDDRYIPPSHSREMYERASGVKQLYLVDGAKHAESVFVNPEEYERIVSGFIDDPAVRSVSPLSPAPPSPL